ncbi:hypothetical protein RUM43_004200 [Polyplax serrata]|uniref:Uncharacterized protein n=1 Tax=Polyplax serrata TaxID=468196 RepID=A0AAN8XKT8_POLSC
MGVSYERPLSYLSVPAVVESLSGGQFQFNYNYKIINQSSKFKAAELYVVTATNGSKKTCLLNEKTQGKDLEMVNYKVSTQEGKGRMLGIKSKGHGLRLSSPDDQRMSSLTVIVKEQPN